MTTKFEIGKTYGKNNALLILDFVYKQVGSKKIRYCKVECQICKKDTELYKDATYIISSDYFNNGKLPCGCSKSHKPEKWQWEIIIKRKAKDNNHTFISFCDSTSFNQYVKLNLRCNTCSHQWNSCSISNYIRGKSCPACAKNIRSHKKTTPDSDWISRFRKTGMFPDSKFKFERLTKTSREWNVYCTICEDTFISDRSNLIAGKIPCNCNNGGGYDCTKQGYFYLLKIELLGKQFLKFGITNFPNRRIMTHIRNLKEYGGVVINKSIYTGKGSEVLKIESFLKKTIQTQNKFIDGFRKEACELDQESLIISNLITLDKVDSVLSV